MVVVISGATKGVGKALAYFFAAKGYSLVIGARSQQKLEEIAADLKEKFAINVAAIKCDFSNEKEVLNFCNKLKQNYTQVDVLVNNVGQYIPDTLTKNSLNTFHQMMQTNLNSAYYLTTNLIPLLKQGKSMVFNICSALSKKVRTEAASYTIAKHALKGFNDLLREELRDKKIKVTAIYPGSINTPSWDGINAPVHEFVQPQDIVTTVEACLNISAHAFIEEVTINPLNKNF